MGEPKNLLEETLATMQANQRTPADVRWVGSCGGDYAVSWEDFAQMADRDYDAGYGFCEVVPDLVVVGDDWWMQRHEYAGKEWWQFNTPPHLNAGESFARIFIEPQDRRIDVPKLRDLNPPLQPRRGT